MSNKKVSKSTMAMFLRTRCDKELYLSLHDKKTMGAAGLPQPVKRPGIGGLSSAGNEFEIERNDQLVRLFPNIIKSDKSSNKYKDLDLETILTGITIPPCIILQGKYSITTNKDLTLRNIGLSSTDVADVPEIADFIPDILVIRNPRDKDLEIQKDGSCKAVCYPDEKRFAIEIFDVKHTSEANPSYCSEIAMYALMLSNWLHHHPTFRDRFYVTTNSYLWTRLKQGDSQLDKLELACGSTTEQLLAALVADSEDANLRFYLAAVRQFFENVVKVIRIGDAEQGAWANLEWHVSGTCAACD